jgi:hypothetical protein
MQTNVSKTKRMVFENKSLVELDSIEMQITNMDIKRVQLFMYLGIFFATSVLIIVEAVRLFFCFFQNVFQLTL